MLVQVLVAVVVFFLMELVSYLVHRFVYHGIGWVIHRSHHTERTGIFELNDLFPLVFASVSISLFLLGLGDPGLGLLVPAAVGMTAYGAVYFLIHDLYIHRRARRLRLRIPALLALKKAHAIHHRDGGEPYGLLFFVTPSRLDTVEVTEDERV